MAAFTAAGVALAVSGMIVFVISVSVGGNFDCLFVGEWQQGIALRTGEASSALLIRKQDNK